MISFSIDIVVWFLHGDWNDSKMSMLLRKELESLELTYPDETSPLSSTETNHRDPSFGSTKVFMKWKKNFESFEWCVNPFFSNFQSEPVKKSYCVTMRKGKNFLCDPESSMKSQTQWIPSSVIHRRFQSQFYRLLHRIHLECSYEIQLKHLSVAWVELAPIQSMYFSCVHNWRMWDIIRIFAKRAIS